MFNEQEKRAGVIVAAIVIAVAGIYLASLTRNSLKAYDYIGKSPEFQNQVPVTGTAKVTAKPDVAVLSIGVTSDKATVQEAQADATNKMNAIIKEIKGKFGIADEDIRTSQYSISPRYDWTDGRQRTIGYNASQNVTVKVRDFTKTGDILAAASSLGANSVNGPEFVIDDIEKYKSEARDEAIKNAKDQARLLADQVGIKLGSIVGYNEGYGGGPIPMFNTMEAKMDAVGGSAAPAPDIQPGSQDVEIQITLIYEIL